MKQDKWWPGTYSVVVYSRGNKGKWYEETIKTFMNSKKAHRLCDKLNKKYDPKETYFIVHNLILYGNYKRNKLD